MKHLILILSIFSMVALPAQAAWSPDYEQQIELNNNVWFGLALGMNKSKVDLIYANMKRAMPTSSIDTPVRNWGNTYTSWTGNGRHLYGGGLDKLYFIFDETSDKLRGYNIVFLPGYDETWLERMPDYFASLEFNLDSYVNGKARFYNDAIAVYHDKRSHSLMITAQH